MVKVNFKRWDEHSHESSLRPVGNCTIYTDQDRNNKKGNINMSWLSLPHLLFGKNCFRDMGMHNFLGNQCNE